jgi:hypothetical protein
LWLVLIGLTALLVFSPVLWGLREVGGYRAVQENHARYLVGLSGWFDSFTRQLASHRHLDGPISWIGLFMAVLLAPAVGGKELETKERSKMRAWLWTISCSIFLAVLAMVLGTSVVLGFIGLIWLFVFCPWWHGPSSESRGGNDLAYWLIAAWFIGLIAATPLYTPYPRLSLPWLLAAWITAASMLGSPVGQRLLTGQAAWQSGRSGTACLFFLGLISVSAFIGKVMSSPPSPPAMWADRTGLESVAAQIHQDVITRIGNDALVYVYAEPALFYHLRAGQMALAAPVANLGFINQSAPVPVLLALGPHAERSESFQAEFERTIHRWELLAEYRYRPSPLVLLDQFSSAELDDLDFRTEQTVRVYRLKPP